MKTVIVIGANSYIARNLIFFLEKKNDIQIKGLYDFSEQHIDGNANYCKIDITSSDSVKKIDMNCDIIYMFVGKTGSANGFDDIDTFIDINEKALLNVLNEYRKQKSKAKIIFPSTRLVYKGSEELLREESEKEFKTIYAINKYACEQYLKQYNMVFDVNYCIFRICVPYGTMINDASSYGTAEFMLSRARAGNNIVLYGDGMQRRSIIFMGDLCNILYLGSISDECINDVFNIGGEDYSLKNMALLIAGQYNVDVEYAEWPDMALKIESGSTVFDDRKLYNVIKHNFEMSYIEWVKQNKRKES